MADRGLPANLLCALTSRLTHWCRQDFFLWLYTTLQHLRHCAACATKRFKHSNKQHSSVYSRLHVVITCQTLYALSLHKNDAERFRA